MRAYELLEASPINLNKVTKEPGRADTFLNLIKSGHTFNSKNGPVTIHPSEIKRIKPLLVKSNVGNRAISKQLMLKTTDGQLIPMSSLHFDSKAFGIKTKTGDADVKLKPTDVLGHKNAEKGQKLTPELALELGAVEGKDLGKSIINSQHLKTQGQAGLAVISMAKQIMAGQPATVPKLTPEQVISVQNDSFEYLGVLSLLHGVANFPNSKEFYKHVGVDLNSMLLYFPGSTNAPLADSFALVNKRTKKTIFISSKGGKSGKGAASSIAGLAIPKYLLDKPSEAVEFIQVCQSMPALFQPFKAANFIQERYPGTLGPIEKFMPFDDQFMSWAKQTWDNRNHGVPTTLAEIPRQYRNIFKLVEQKMGDSKYELFYNIRNYVKDHCIMPAINSGKVIPDFSPIMMEMLAQNFIKLGTKAVKGTFVTDVTWPYKMGGKIELRSKSPANIWGASITWLLI